MIFYINKKNLIGKSWNDFLIISWNKFIITVRSPKFEILQFNSAVLSMIIVTFGEAVLSKYGAEVGFKLPK